MDGGAWWATVHGVTKSQTQLRNFTFTFSILNKLVLTLCFSSYIKYEKVLRDYLYQLYYFTYQKITLLYWQIDSLPLSHLGSQFIYLAALGLSCGMRDFQSLLQHVGSNSLTRGRTQAPIIQSVESQPLGHQRVERELYSFSSYFWLICLSSSLQDQSMLCSIN